MGESGDNDVLCLRGVIRIWKDHAFGQEQSLQLDFLDTTFDVYDLMVLFLVHRYVYLYTDLVQAQSEMTWWFNAVQEGCCHPC
jgi:hypothetical protein